MAYIQNRSGKYLVQIKRQGFPVQHKTFQTKIDAERWARAVEREMDMGAFINRKPAESTTFAKAAERYELEILPTKRGKAQDESRLRGLVAWFGPYSLASIDSYLISKYVAGRAKAASPQTVVHDINLLKRIFTACVQKWKIALPGGIPTLTVERPKLRNERNRRLEAGEEALLMAALAESGSKHPNPWMLPLATLAVETAGRQSELLSLRWDEVDLRRATARLRGVDGRETKNSDPYRDVPLTPRAVAALSALPRAISGRVFPLTGNAVKLSWRRAVDRARRTHLHGLLRERLHAEGIDADAELRALVFKKRKPQARTLALLADIEKIDKTLVDLHFHDLRHEATSRLAEVLQMHELMKVTGHKSSKMLARYYHPRAEDLAAKLAAKLG